MGGTQHNQGVKSLKYLFQICWFCSYHFFNPCLNKCHLFPELCCFLTSRNEWFYASPGILSRKWRLAFCWLRPELLSLLGRANEADKLGNKIMVQYIFICPGGKGKTRSTRVLVVSFSLGYLSEGCWNLRAPFSVDLKLSIQMKKLNWGGNAVTAISVCPTFLQHQE